MCSQAQLKVILQVIYKNSVAEFGDQLDAVILYGSYARGDYKEDSDIDVMVRVKMDKVALASYRRKMSSLANHLDLTYNVFVSIKLQDFDTFSRYQEALPFYRNILKEGVRVGA